MTINRDALIFRLGEDRAVGLGTEPMVKVDEIEPCAFQLPDEGTTAVRILNSQAEREDRRATVNQRRAQMTLGARPSVFVRARSDRAVARCVPASRIVVTPWATKSGYW